MIMWLTDRAFAMIVIRSRLGQACFTSKMLMQSTIYLELYIINCYTTLHDPMILPGVTPAIHTLEGEPVERVTL